MGDRVVLFEQGSIANVRAHESEFVSRVLREGSESQCEMGQVVARRRHEVEQQQHRAATCITELSAARGSFFSHRRLPFYLRDLN